MSRVEGEATGRESSQRPRRAWWRRGVSLRSLMIVVLVVGGGLGWIVHRTTTRARAIATILAAGGRVVYQDEFPQETSTWTTIYRWTGWGLCRVVDRVQHAHLSGSPALANGSVAAQIARAVAELPETRIVLLGDAPLATSDLRLLAGTGIEQLRLAPIQDLVDDCPEQPTLLPRLQSLQLGMEGDADLPRAALDLAARMPALERLYLESPLAPVRGDDLAPLARLRRLTLLDLNRTVVDEGALTSLDAVSTLEALWVRRARVSDATLANIIARHPNLISLDVDGSDLTDAGVATLTRLPRLVMVNLHGTPADPGRLTDASLIALGRIKSLRRLVVTCGRFTSTGLDALRDQRWVRLALREIEPNSTPALVRLLQGKSLEWLRLGGSGVTDDLLPQLAASLIPRRAILDLSDSAITDAGMIPLAALPISELVLNRTAITDAGVTTLTQARHNGPRSVYLDETKATAEGIAVLDQLHPDFRQQDDLPNDD